MSKIDSFRTLENVVEQNAGRQRNTVLNHELWDAISVLTAEVRSLRAALDAQSKGLDKQIDARIETSAKGSREPEKV